MNGKKDKREEWMERMDKRTNGNRKLGKEKGTGLEQSRGEGWQPAKKPGNFLVTPLEDQIILTTPQYRGGP